jgi:transcriptional regulator with XRE-family HTH domain
MGAKNDLAEIIATTRARLRLNQSEFGKPLGVAGPTIGTYERGDQDPPLNVRERLVSVYGVPAESVGLAIVTEAKLGEQALEFISEAYRLALAVLSDGNSNETQRQSATLVLERFARLPDKPGSF